MEFFVVERKYLYFLCTIFQKQMKETTKVLVETLVQMSQTALQLFADS